MYSVKGFVEYVNFNVYSKSLPKQIVSFIWQRKAPPRAKFVAWFLARGKLKTCGYLLHLNLISEEHIKCVFCNNEFETDSHLFSSCVVT